MRRLLKAAVGVASLFMAMSVLAGPVDVNTADAQTLSQELTGIGLARAQAIVDYRKEHGPFKRAEDLLKVKGVGQRTLEMNRENIRIAASGK